MRKLAFTVVAVVIATILLFVFRSSPQPTYQGRTISAWQDDWAAGKNRVWYDALQHLGTNALPWMVQNLTLRDAAWRTGYTTFQAKLPGLLQRVFRKPKPLLQEVDGANAFYYIGSNSIPSAIALLKHKSPSVRRAAAWGVSSLRGQTPAASQAIPALTAALADNDRMVRFDAALALQEMGPEASNAVLALTREVANAGTGPTTNEFFYNRAVAAVALGKIGPSASSALPALEAALHESNSYLRGQSAVAIWRITGDVDTTLPVLLKEMPSNDENTKWDWVIALGEMGPRARAAISQLKTELRTDRDPWNANLATNALKSIDPAWDGTSGRDGK